MVLESLSICPLCAIFKLLQLQKSSPRNMHALGDNEWLCFLKKDALQLVDVVDRRCCSGVGEEVIMCLVLYSSIWWEMRQK